MAKSPPSPPCPWARERAHPVVDNDHGVLGHICCVCCCGKSIFSRQHVGQSLVITRHCIDVEAHAAGNAARLELSICIPSYRSTAQRLGSTFSNSVLCAAHGCDCCVQHVADAGVRTNSGIMRSLQHGRIDSACTADCPVPVQCAAYAIEWANVLDTSQGSTPMLGRYHDASSTRTLLPVPEPFLSKRSASQLGCTRTGASEICELMLA